MFNQYTGGNIKQTVTSLPRGTLMKTHPKSWFKKYHLESPMANSLHTKNGDIIILQSMLVGNKEVLSELVDKKEFLKEVTNED